MATQSLYRRYRPRRFSELKGQDHVVKALRTAVAEGREGQAYLFSGPRGTGKTSTARILAKVLNCENPQDGEPCCECESCIAVERGTSYDVHELDAASNNGVDAMRDLIEKASLGTPGRHKVYILDEVHMLSKAAEAALLKTLEEPPPHVVFVLATTDPQKMSATIISRTQHLQFHLLAADTLAEHIRWVAADAGLDVSDASFEQVLNRGGGSARDTLSALELVASTGEGGLTEIALDEFVEAMIDRDAGRALTMVAHAISLGSDPRTLTEALVGYLRNGFLSLMAPELVQVPSGRLDGLAEQAQRLGAAGLVRGIEVLGSSLTEMRHAPDPRVLLDIATVQLTADSVATDTAALLGRIERLERQMAEGGAGSAAPAAATRAAPVDPSTGRAALGGRARQAGPAAAGAGPEASAPAGPTGPASETATPETATPQTTTPQTTTPETTTPETTAPGAPAAPPPAVSPTSITADVWELTVRPALRGMPRAIYAPAAFVASTPTTLTLSVPNAAHRAKCEQHRAAVEAALREFAGAAVQIELVDDGGGTDGGERHVAPVVRETPSAPANGTMSTGLVSTGPESDPGPTMTAVAPNVGSALPDDDEVDLDDLTDAPPEFVKSPIERLAEAFPGSELIEEAG